MRSLWNEADRKNLLVRIDKLPPNAEPRWGRMSAAQTLAHLADWMRMLTGELKVKSRNTPFRFPVIKQLIIYAAPFPKNVPTAPELLKTNPVEWADTTIRLTTVRDRSRIGSSASRVTRTPWVLRS